MENYSQLVEVFVENCFAGSYLPFIKLYFNSFLMRKYRNKIEYGKYFRLLFKILILALECRVYFKYNFIRMDLLELFGGLE